MKLTFDSATGFMCKTVDDCKQKDAVTERAWLWSQRITLVGRLIFVIILIGGLLFFAFTGDKPFSRNTVYITVYIVALILEYLIYHVAAVSLQCMASINHRLGIIANLKEFDVRHDDNCKSIKTNDSESDSVKFVYSTERE